MRMWCANWCVVVFYYVPSTSFLLFFSSSFSSPPLSSSSSQPSSSSSSFLLLIFLLLMSLQPILGLGLSNPTPSVISILRRPSPVPAFQLPLCIPNHCIYNRLSLDLPSGLLFSTYFFNVFCGSVSSFILII